MVHPIFWLLGGAAVATVVLSDSPKKKELPKPKPADDPNLIEGECKVIGEADLAAEREEKRRQEEFKCLLDEACKKTAEARETAIKRVREGSGRITNFQVLEYENGVAGRQLQIDWDGEPNLKLHVMKVVGQPQTSDIGKIMRADERCSKVLAVGLTNRPAEINDPEEKHGVETVYYAWLEQEFSYPKYQAIKGQSALSLSTTTEAFSYGLVLENMLLSKPVPQPPAEKKPARTVPGLKVDEFTQAIVIALTPIVEDKLRGEKLEEVIEEHGLEDYGSDVAEKAYAVLDQIGVGVEERGHG